SADTAAAKAASELRAGNVKAAGLLARGVLEAVTDHTGAQDVARQTGGVAERVAQLEEFVELGQWCAANEIVRQLRDRMVSDPRTARLSARTKAAVAGIDFNIQFLGVVLAVVVAAGVVGVPWLGSALPPPSGSSPNFYYYVW